MKAKHYLLALAAGVFIALPGMGDWGRYIWGAAFAVLAAVLLAVGAANAEERKKKEHESRCVRVDARRAEVEALEAEVEALHQRNTTPPPPGPGSGIGNAQEVDLHGVPGDWSSGRKVPAEMARPVTGNAVQLEINEEN